LDHARWELVRLQDAIDPLLGPLFETRLLLVRRVDDLTQALVDALVLHAQRLEIDRRELDVAQLLRGHFRSRRDRFFHRTRLERARDDLIVEEIEQLRITHLVDADLLFRLEATHLPDALTAILLDDLILDAREDLHIDYHPFHAGWHLQRRVLHV